MIKAVVIGASFYQFASYMRSRHYNRDNYGYYKGSDIGQILGLKKDTPVHWLEGWWENPKITVGDYLFIRNVFYGEHKDITERKIYHEGFVF